MSHKLTNFDEKRTVKAFRFLPNTLTQAVDIVWRAVENTLQLICFASLRAYFIEIDHSESKPVILHFKLRLDPLYDTISLLVLTDTPENSPAGTWPPPIKVSISVNSYFEIFQNKKFQNTDGMCEILILRKVRIMSFIIWPLPGHFLHLWNAKYPLKIMGN